MPLDTSDTETNANPDNRQDISAPQSNTNSEPLHVLDLPALYTRPSGTELLEILNQLTLKPASFNAAGTSSSPSIDESGVPAYLTSIISSSLKWIDDETLQEDIWECASRRLAERAGRSAQPSLTRSFTLPTGDVISLFEPSLTADNLGHKTWSSSYVLATKLISLSSILFGSGYEHASPYKVLELGSGTGLFGIAFAALFPNVHVLLTDLPEIVPNLAINVDAAQDLALRHGSSIQAAELDWDTCPAVPSSVSIRDQIPASVVYDIILVADPIYSPAHPALLTRAIAAHLSRSPKARLVLGLPIREAYLPQLEELWSLLAGIGLKVLKQGEEEGTDDWVDRYGQLVKVTVRWAVWTWI